MFQQLMPALRATVVLAILTGIIFPFLVTAVAQVLFPECANGSLIRGEKGQIIGSKLIGQSFKQPQYFHPRPSAAGSGYDGIASGGTNLGPTSEKLINGQKDTFMGVKQLAVQYRMENNLPSNALVPVDAVTRSGSGLDPHISSKNAHLQVSRIAKVRNLSEKQVSSLISKYTEPRDLGFLGEPRVNVFLLNLALDRLTKERPSV